MADEDKKDGISINYVQCPFQNPGKPVRTFVLPQKDKIVSHATARMRWWEHKFTSDLFKLAARGDEGSAFFDVGANIGTTSVVAADFFGKIYAFEFERINCAVLRKAMEINNIEYELFECAVSRKVGETVAYIDPNNMGGHSLEILDSQMQSKVSVKTITLDSLDKFINNVRFLHIDTEGHDFHVIAGSHDFVARQKVLPFIELEFSPRAIAKHGSSMADLLSFMDKFGYHAYMNASNALAPLSRTALSEMFHQWKTTQAWIDIYLIP